MNIPTFDQAVGNVKQTKLQLASNLMFAAVRGHGASPMSVTEAAVLAEKLIEQCMFEPVSDEIADGIKKDISKMEAEQVEAGNIMQMPMQD